jgi:cytoskeletal protein CcmA (bactofilin family)
MAGVRRGRRVRKVAGMTDAGAVAVPEAAAKDEKHVTLGAEIDVAGSIYVDGVVRLEGTIDGEIRCTAIEVTRDSHVRGRIVAERVTVYGTVSAGSIYANTLVLRPGCHVEAEIYYEELQLEAGSYFDGKSRRVTDPTAMVVG